MRGRFPDKETLTTSPDRPVQGAGAPGASPREEADARQHPRGRRGPLRYAVRLVAGTLSALFVGLLVWGVITRAPDTSIDDSLAQAQPVVAPGFKLEVLLQGDLGPRLGDRLKALLADGRVGLEELRGTPVVLNFWASWCVPCREEAPLLQSTWRQQARPRGVLFVGLDMQDVTDDARGFLREFRIDYLNIRDQSNPVARRYGVTGIPETFFITAKGKIVGHVIGVASPQQLREGIAATLSGRPIGATPGGAQRPTR